MPAGAEAAQVASLSAKPARAKAGERFAVVGRRFPARARVRLYFGSKRVKTLRSSRRGRFRVRLRVPARSPRLYRLTARARRVRVRVRFRLLTTPAKKALPVQAAAPPPAPPPPPPPRPPTLVAAGDISCAPPGTPTATTCRHGPVSNLVQSLDADAVATLGDNQYEHGELANFNASFDPTWGRFKSLIHPIPGNHEYDSDATAAGYYSYFGAAAGDPDEGYYAYDVGSWRVFVLNSGDLQNTVDCAPVSCALGSDQADWLEAELDTLPADKCVIGAIHHPHHASFASRAHPVEEDALWDSLYDHGAELLLSGHDHQYERFRPMSDATTVDDSYGIRQFIVGTGGRSHDGAPPPQVANSEKLLNQYFGVLELQLSPGSYTFRFLDEAGNVRDSGSGSCHPPHP